MTTEFRFSRRSFDFLDTVHPKLAFVATKALKRSLVDFGVICGRRTQEEQKELIRIGASQTMESKHLSGNAIDVCAYIGSRVSWDLPLYCEIADAFRAASKEGDVPLRWGGAWQVHGIAEYSGNMEQAMEEYIALKVRATEKPFVDAGHFELWQA